MKLEKASVNFTNNGEIIEIDQVSKSEMTGN